LNSLNFWSFTRFLNRRFVCLKRSFKYNIKIFDALKFFFNSLKNKFVLIYLKFFDYFKSFCIIFSFCRFLITNINETLRYLFNEMNIFF
jgi:hypothetical protein